MYALYKESSNKIMQQWANKPEEIAIPEANLMIMCPHEGWSYLGYKLIPITHEEDEKHQFSISNGTTEEVKIVDDKHSLVIKNKYKNPPLKELKASVIALISNNINARNTAVDFNYPTVIEALQLKIDIEPDIFNYPLLNAYIGIKEDNVNITTLAEAADYVMEEFKVKKKMVAEHNNFLKTRIEEINSAKTAADVLAIHNRKTEVNEYPDRQRIV